MSLESRSKIYGSRFGDWVTGEQLGSGSNGKTAVYLLTKDNDPYAVCALKVINLLEETGSFNAMPDYRKCDYQVAAQTAKSDALREVVLMSQLRGNTNIVDYLDHDIVSWQDEKGFGVDLLIRMEKLEDLRKKIKSNTQFSHEEIRRLGIDICRALLITHRKQIIHRDIKPENIFISPDGDYKLGDFGIARIMSSSPTSRASTGIGTAAYSAPEQIRGSYDERVDIYSLGLVMYELLNGNRLPFANTSYVHDSQIQLRLSGVPLPPPQAKEALSPYSTQAVPDSALSAIILKACAHHPDNRYQSAGQMLDDLLKIGVHPVPIVPKSGHSRPVHPVHIPSDSVPKPPTAQESFIPKIWKYMIPVLVLCAVVTGLILGNLFRHRHSWQDATCTKPRICTECAKTSGEPLGHQWMDATCTSPRTCVTCGATSGISIDHIWKPADCLNPQTCAVCGLTQGNGIGHSWISATCTEAEYCSICGETGNQALGHNWSDATCESPRHCTLCNKQTGSPLEHDWLPATFRNPITCSQCSSTIGDPIPTESISVDAEIQNIKNIYYDIMDRRERGMLRTVWIQDGLIQAFYESTGELAIIEIHSGVSGRDGYGSNYMRMYVYHNNKLIFALLSGQDSHRLYFYEEMQIRWLYRPNNAIPSDEYYHDLTFTSDYIKWEELALEEGRSFLS